MLRKLHLHHLNPFSGERSFKKDACPGAHCPRTAYVRRRASSGDRCPGAYVRFVGAAVLPSRDPYAMACSAMAYGSRTVHSLLSYFPYKFGHGTFRIRYTSIALSLETIPISRAKRCGQSDGADACSDAYQFNMLNLKIRQQHSYIQFCMQGLRFALMQLFRTY